MGSILYKLVAFKRASTNEDCLQGLIYIDEFEASFHPVTQTKFFDFLLKTFVTRRLDQFICFMVKQFVECLFNVVSDKIFKMVLYKSFIQLYNAIRYNSLPPWDIGYGDLIVPRAKTYVYIN